MVLEGTEEHSSILAKVRIWLQSELTFSLKFSSNKTAFVLRSVSKIELSAACNLAVVHIASIGKLIVIVFKDSLTVQEAVFELSSVCEGFASVVTVSMGFTSNF